MSIQNRWSQWRIGRLTALSILLIGIASVQPFAIFFSSNDLLYALLSPFSSPVLLYTGYASVAFMLLAMCVLLLGSRRGEGEVVATEFAVLAMIAYSFFSFPGHYSYSLWTPTLSVTATGLGPVQYSLYRLFGYHANTVVLYSALVALSWIAIIAAIYLLAKLSWFGSLGKLFPTLASLPVAASFFLSIYLTYSTSPFSSPFSARLVNQILDYVFIMLIFIVLIFSLALPIGCLLIYSLNRKNSKRHLQGRGAEDL